MCIGGDGNDVLDGGDGNDELYGEAGNDTLTGGEGDDSLDGADGADVMNGGNGNDTVLTDHVGDLAVGGAGNDYLDADVTPNQNPTGFKNPRRGVLHQLKGRDERAQQGTPIPVLSQPIARYSAWENTDVIRPNARKAA